MEPGLKIGHEGVDCFIETERLFVFTTLHKYILPRRILLRGAPARVAVCLGLAGFSIMQAYGQQVALSLGSASAPPGSTVTIPLSLSSSGGAQPTSLQWTMAYPPTLSVVGVSAGSSAASVAKSVVCATVSGSTTCVLFGMNTLTIGNGQVATATFLIASGTAAGTASLSLSNVVASNAAGSSIPTSATGGAITILQPVSVTSLNNLSCSPVTVNSPGSSSCSITLTGPAPSSGFSVSLSVNNTNVTVPGSVTVPGGATSAAFTASVAAVSADQSATLTAAAGGVTRNVSLTLVAPPQLSSLSCTPATLGSGQSATCTVALTKPASSAATVALTRNTELLTMPASVTISAGASAANFVATAGAPNVDQSATIYATWNGNTRSATLNLVAPVTLSGLTCAPATVSTPGSSQCSVSLNRAADKDGFRVTLASDNANLTVPDSVTVPSGATTAVFTATAVAIGADQNAVVTATGGGASRAFSLSLLSPALLSTLSCTPETLLSGQTTTCTATLSKPATSQMTVVLSSNQSVLSVPASLTIQAGSPTGTFTAAAGVSSVNLVATVSATWNGETRTAAVNVLQSGAQQFALSLNSASASPGSTVTLNVSALASGGAKAAALQWTMNYPAVLSSLSTEAGPAASAAGKSVSCAVNSGSTTCVAFGMNANTLGDGVVARTTFRIANEAAPGVVPISISNLVASDAAGNSIPTSAFSGAITILPPPQINLNEELLSIKGESQSTHGLTARNAANPNSEAFCSPGSWAVLFGKGFTSEAPLHAQTVPLPVNIGKVQVSVNGTPAPLLLVSESKISFQCPMLPHGTPIQVQVESEAGIAILESTMLEATPALYALDSSGFGQGVALIAGTNDLAMPSTEGVAARPVRKGEYLSIYANGLGETEEKLAAGASAPLDRLIHVKNKIRVYLGGIEIAPAFVGLSPGAVGLYQINLPVPPEAPVGAEISLYIEVILSDGSVVTSNTVTVAIDETPAAE